jgi:hypothetical protein
MSDVPDKFDAEYYDKDYFVTPEGKHFCGSDGSVHGWSYNNETGEFHGAGPITKAWKTLFEPETLLDVGAGRGTFIAYARDIGIEAYGFDYSKWAVSEEGRYPRCKEEWLWLHDALDPWLYPNGFADLTVALDFYEHIYFSDLYKVIPEMYRVTNNYLFLQIATAGDTVEGGEGEGYILKKGEPVPPELEGCAVAGHVTVMPEKWWVELFDVYDEEGAWMRRPDLERGFVALVDDNIIRNWLLNTILVYERID